LRLFVRIARHLRLTWQTYMGLPSPPFLILFINSICNQKCEHCFYWRNLNRKDDLTRDELFALSRSLGRIENLNLSGGEPFLRPEFAEICRQFVRQNGVREIYVPTNATFTERMVRQITETLREEKLRLFAVEFSLDGLAEFHDRFRGQKGAFAKAMESYDALVRLQERDPRLRLHANSTATSGNIEEIRRLTTYLFERCPSIDHHNLAVIRGDRKNPALEAPDPQQYRELYAYIRRLWLPREQGRYGSVVEPMMQWAKDRILREKRQVIPCSAGLLSTVVYSNGDVSVCELHQPLGNLRDRSFTEIWHSPEARRLRRSIARKECYCTTEVFLWPSIVYRPLHLLRAILGAKPWRAAPPVVAQEQAFVPLDALAPFPAKNGAQRAAEWKSGPNLLPVVCEQHD
jgi:MoaA/NifB/PqqE/SkfB family radical SAM enzyme